MNGPQNVGNRGGHPGQYRNQGPNGSRQGGRFNNNRGGGNRNMPRQGQQDYRPAQAQQIPPEMAM